MSKNLSRALAHPIYDTKQSAYQLSAIQLTSAASLPVLATSIYVRQLTSLKGAVLSLLISYLILFIIRWVVILASTSDIKQARVRKSTLDVAFEYGGNFGGFIIALVLLFATLAWFVAQTTFATNALLSLHTFNTQNGVDYFVRISMGLSLLSALLCMPGIVALKKASIIGLPIILTLLLSIVSLAPAATTTTEVPFVLSGVFAGLLPIVGAGLGVTADIPTFFRHSQSKKESLKALVIMQLIGLSMGFSGLYLGGLISADASVASQFSINIQSIAHLKTLLITLIATTTVFANVTNIYAASVAWELFARNTWVGRQEFLLLGFILSISFILFSNIIPAHLLITVTDIALVNLCIVIMVGYIAKRIMRTPPNSYQKTVYFSVWCLATILNIIQELELITLISPLVFGFLFISIFSVCALVIERVYIKMRQI